MSTASHQQEEEAAVVLPPRLLPVVLGTQFVWRSKPLVILIEFNLRTSKEHHVLPITLNGFLCCLFFLFFASTS